MKYISFLCIMIGAVLIENPIGFALVLAGLVFGHGRA